MSISFNDIPATVRVPLTYVEFDNTAAVSGTPGIQYKLLVLGQMLDSGKMDAATPTPVTNTAQADRLAGQGSQLAGMLKAAIAANPMMEVWTIGLADAGSGEAATGTIAVSASDVKAGAIALYVAGQRFNIGVAAEADKDTIAQDIEAAINAQADCAVTATSASGTVTLTAKQAGECGNDIDLRDSYYTDESLPDGVELTYNAMSGGAVSPNVQDAIDVMGDEWYNAIVMPWTDTANLNALRDELISRWGPTRMIDGIAFAALRGTYGEVSTFGDGRNDFLISCMDAGASPTPSWIWAAVNGAVAAASLSIDPARPLQTLTLPGVLAPALVDRRMLSERNLLLHDGISTHRVDAGGNVLIERQITTYQENALGAPDPSYLDVNTPATLSYLRYSTNTRIRLRFPRYKLADNGTRVAPGQAIVTPNIIKSELIALANEWEDAGLVENVDQYKKTLIVERNANDRNRVDVLAQPDLINQFRIFAEQIQFIL